MCSLQVEELQRPSEGTNDQQVETVEQIAQILRRQLDTLEWIDEQTGESCRGARTLHIFLKLTHFI